MFNLTELTELHTSCLNLIILCNSLKNEGKDIGNSEELIRKFNYKINSLIKILKEQKEDLAVNFSDKVY